MPESTNDAGDQLEPQAQSEENESQSQTQTQAFTQVVSHVDEEGEDKGSDLWGILIPCNPGNPHISRIDLKKDKRCYTIGRREVNDIRFADCALISGKHCTIEWDGNETPNAAVVVTDTSTNGTFINGRRIGADGKGKYKILTDGCEIAFGINVSTNPNRAKEDYRFLFRHRASKGATTAVEKVYDLRDVLGVGSFGTVVKGLHRSEGVWYAVKIIPANKLRQGLMTKGSMGPLTPDNLPESMKREIDVMQRLSHRNICHFKEVFIEEKEIDIVLEWVKGGDLMDYLLKTPDPGLPEPTVQYLTYQICDALTYVHDLGIAHRDLKPENILLTDDNPPVVKIADFGLAKVVDTMTALHTLCGTPAYLAPEVVGGGNVYDRVVDSWSVGVIVYCMLTKSTPFLDEEAPGTTDLSRRVARRKVEWVLLQHSGVSDHGQDFIRRLLEVDPTKRATPAEARDHQWLAQQARLHRDGGIQAAAASSQSPPVVHITPPSAPSTPPGQPLAPDVSMCSVASDRMAVDTASIVMADATAEEAVQNSRGMTPSFAMLDDDPSSSSPSHPSSGSDSTSSQRAPLQRRADVIRQAQSMGVELPTPSQEMQERALAEDAERANDRNLAAVAVAPQIPAAAAADVPSRGSKRKAEDLSYELSPPLDAGAINAHPAGDVPLTSTDAAAGGAGRSPSRRAHGGSAASPKRPVAKKARTQSSAPVAPAETGPRGEEEVPGLALARRRSSRLASPTKPKSGRKN